MKRYVIAITTPGGVISDPAGLRFLFDDDAIAFGKSLAARIALRRNGEDDVRTVVVRDLTGLRIATIRVPARATLTATRKARRPGITTRPPGRRDDPPPKNR
jgi:hypothetical protein